MIANELSADQNACLEALAQSFGPDRVIRDRATCAFFASDVWEEGEPAAAVIRPADVASLQAILAQLHQARFALLPRGGGVTYTSGYQPDRPDSVTLDLRDLNKILAVSADDLFISVEAGCTWKQIHDALSPMGLRLPCFGTHSGRHATVGGGLSGGAVFFGSARYGTAADGVLGLDVMLADGREISTGQRAIKAADKPAYRGYGPDLTGLFMHDAGSLAIKTRATFRLIQTPKATGYASFAFSDQMAAARALSAIARANLAEDLYIFDPPTSARAMGGMDLLEAGKALARGIAAADNVREGLSAAARIAQAGRGVAAGAYTLHVVAANQGPKGLEEDLVQTRRLAEAEGGRAIAETVPRLSRANLFGPLNGILTPEGKRWAALNAKVPHSGAAALVAKVNALFDAHRAAMEDLGITTSCLMMAIGPHGFSFEPVFQWPDTWLPLHRTIPEPEHLAALSEPDANPKGRALVGRLREQVMAIFAEQGAASNQIGRAYPYRSLLKQGSGDALGAIKAILDPHGLVNPGALGF